MAFSRRIYTRSNSFNLKSLLTFIFSLEHRQTRQPVGFDNQENNQLHETCLHAVSDCGNVGNLFLMCNIHRTDLKLIFFGQ